MRANLIPRLAVGGWALLCIAMPAEAAAPRRPALPRYDTGQLCDTGIAGTAGQILRELCVRPEREALANMRRRWSALPAEMLTRCIEQQTSLQQTYGRGGSYRGLKTCVDEPVQSEGEVPPTELRTGAGAGARTRRGGTTTGSTAATTNNPSSPGGGIDAGTGLGTPGLGTPGFGTTGTGLGTTGAGTPGLGNTGLGGTTGTGLGTTGTGLGTTSTGTGGTGTTGLGASGLGTAGAGSSLGGTTGGASSSGGGGAGGGGGGGR